MTKEEFTLKAGEKITLDPGETKKMRIELTPEEAKFFIWIDRLHIIFNFYLSGLLFIGIILAVGGLIFDNLQVSNWGVIIEWISIPLIIIGWICKTILKRKLENSIRSRLIVTKEEA